LGGEKTIATEFLEIVKKEGEVLFNLKGVGFEGLTKIKFSKIFLGFPKFLGFPTFLGYIRGV